MQRTLNLCKYINYGLVILYILCKNEEEKLKLKTRDSRFWQFLHIAHNLI